MKALVYDGVKTLTFREMPKPVPAMDEHLIRISAVGICGSDMHAYLGHDERRPAPLILGHEAAGVVESGAQEGRRVTINPLVTCGECQYCLAGRDNLCPSRQIISMQPREGAFAQFVAMPDRNLVTVPANVSLEKAALAEPLAVSWHAARLALETLHSSMNRTAIVIGGGAIGLAAALSLRAMGVQDVTIIEPNDQRREYLASKCGQTVADQASGTASLVVDAVGYSATRAVASQLVSPGGVIAHVGLGDNSGGMDVRRLTLQEITFVGTYTYTAKDFRDTSAALFDGNLGSLDWYEMRALEKGAAAFCRYTLWQNGRAKNHSKPVAITQDATMYKNILVPLALNHGISEQTLKIAQKLGGSGAKITALYVYEMPQGSVNAYLGEEFITQGLERAQELLAAKISGFDGVNGEIVREHAYRTIVDFADEHNFDCIVIGSHQPGLSDYLIGSTAARVVRHASCAVHVHRAPQALPTRTN